MRYWASPDSELVARNPELSHFGALLMRPVGPEDRGGQFAAPTTEPFADEVGHGCTSIASTSTLASFGQSDAADGLGRVQHERVLVDAECSQLLASRWTCRDSWSSAPSTPRQYPCGKAQSLIDCVNVAVVPSV